MSPKLLTRRRFLEQSLQSAGLLALGSVLGPNFVRDVLAAGTTGSVGPSGTVPNSQKRFLINIQTRGGWDSMWSHCARSPDYFRPASKGYTLNCKRIITGTNTRTITDVNGRTQTVQQSFSREEVTNELGACRSEDLSFDPSLTSHPKYHNRFTQAIHNASKYIANNGGEHSFGYLPGIAGTHSGYSARAAFTTDILVLKGLELNALGHGQSNQMQLHGLISQYAITYSSLIAGHLARTEGYLPLHYVQLSNTPLEFYSNVAMAKGAQIPINISSYSTFQGLTQPSSNDVELSVRSLVDQTIQNLAGQAGTKSFKSSSRKVLDAFQFQFGKAQEITAGYTAKKPEFIKLWIDYATRSSAAVLELISKQATDFDIGAATQGATTFAGFVDFNTGPPSSAKTQVEALQRALTSSLNKIGGATRPEEFTSDWIAFQNKPGYAQSIVKEAFSFAMAEYLVTNTLSAVVDVPFLNGDFHNGSEDEIFQQTKFWTHYLRLLKNLKEKGFLDRTLVSVISDFDRSPALETFSDPIHRGTNHWYTASVLLAGYRIPGGKVVGDMKDDVQYDNNNFSSIPFMAGLPIDKGNGAPVNPTDSKAMLPNIKHLFPTLMAAFGAEIPLQQQTEANALNCLLKG